MCFTVKTNDRKVTFLCDSRGQRNAWVAGLKLLRSNNVVAKQFKARREYVLKQRLKPIEVPKEESSSSSGDYRENDEKNQNDDCSRKSKSKKRKSRDYNLNNGASKRRKSKSDDEDPKWLEHINDESQATTIITPR